MKLNHKLHKASHNLVSLRLIPNRRWQVLCRLEWSLSHELHTRLWLVATHDMNPIENHKMSGQIFFDAYVTYLSNYIYNPRDFKYSVKHSTTILFSRSCHCMDHRECGLTWKLVCQSALYSPFKVSRLDFSATNLVWKRMFFKWSYEQKYYLLQSGGFQSIKNVD